MLRFLDDELGRRVFGAVLGRANGEARVPTMLQSNIESVRMSSIGGFMSQFLARKGPLWKLP